MGMGAPIVFISLSVHLKWQCSDLLISHIGITSINKQSYAFLMATPEKALCDLIANSPQVNLRYAKDVEVYLEDDIRMDIDDFRNMDISVFEHYAEVGKKAGSIQSLIKYLKK